MTCMPALALRISVALAALVLPAVDAGYGPWHGSAFAASDEEAAKALGTVEAWDAFLTHYPNGFRARAYVKKLADLPQFAPSPPAPPTAASAGSANDDFPAAAGSWGGVLRDGPGQQYRKIGSLAEGEPVTLMARTDVMDNGFPWFKITTKAGQTGYQWGGILCAIGTERPDLFQTCPAGSASQSDTPKTSANNPPKKKKKRCPAGEYLNQLGACQPNETGQ